MSTAVKEMHAFDAARDAGRPPFKVADLSLDRTLGLRHRTIYCPLIPGSERRGEGRGRWAGARKLPTSAIVGTVCPAQVSPQLEVVLSGDPQFRELEPAGGLAAAD